MALVTCSTTIRRASTRDRIVTAADIRIGIRNTHLILHGLVQLHEDSSPMFLDGADIICRGEGDSMGKISDSDRDRRRGENIGTNAAPWMIFVEGSKERSPASKERNLSALTRKL